jgi:hypothetical protein
VLVMVVSQAFSLEKVMTIKDNHLIRVNVFDESLIVLGQAG